MKNKGLKIIITTLVLLALIASSVVYYLSQNIKTIGYVVEARDNRIMIISEKGYKKFEGNVPSDLREVKDEMLSEYTTFYIPKFNKLIGSTYDKNEKIKVYWEGIVLESLPVQIPGTNLIRKIE
ncbi:DUF3221 domain-containing protein [Bacillus massiliigorillae]|uniref:DUF3221 domain-containing protein n=1 Tax=Bacillus massiliigorillae TaxID=1243664 RepID=UPI0005A7B55D|nr:DUF3221 domain-containing protein [Bacillus massiliigorillae]